jgi:GTP cyclohydrolase I
MADDQPHDCVYAPEGAVVAAAAYARAMLQALDIMCDDDGTRDTPMRFVSALAELTSGLRVSPDRHFARTFPAPSPNPGMIVVPGIPFTSICEHHLLTFTGSAAVGYVPAAGARILGLSKLARVVQEYAARPQMQERLGDQVVEAVGRNLDVVGVACVIRSTHSCMALRGVRAAGAEMVTSHLRGSFRVDGAQREEFFALAKNF